ncbi:MAG: DUF6531 domain-containing protein [bacterium]
MIIFISLTPGFHSKIVEDILKKILGQLLDKKGKIKYNYQYIRRLSDIKFEGDFYKIRTIKMREFASLLLVLLISILILPTKECFSEEERGCGIRRYISEVKIVSEWQIDVMVMVKFSEDCSQSGNYIKVWIEHAGWYYEDIIYDVAVGEWIVHTFHFFTYEQMANGTSLRIVLEAYSPPITFKNDEVRGKVYMDTKNSILGIPYDRNVLIFEPINITNGNMIMTSKDMFLPGKNLHIKFDRTYNSRSNEIGPFGYGWTHSYNMALLTFEWVNDIIGKIPIKIQRSKYDNKTYI